MDDESLIRGLNHVRGVLWCILYILLVQAGQLDGVDCAVITALRKPGYLNGSVHASILHHGKGGCSRSASLGPTFGFGQSMLIGCKHPGKPVLPDRNTHPVGRQHDSGDRRGC